MDSLPPHPDAPSPDPHYLVIRLPAGLVAACEELASAAFVGRSEVARVLVALGLRLPELPPDCGVDAGVRITVRAHPALLAKLDARTSPRGRSALVRRLLVAGTGWVDPRAELEVSPGPAAEISTGGRIGS